eukprot:Protomagalhaensia_sp_Gyna_25__2464@NODE_2376_length_1122_cov_8_048015_g1970_i0_p1_GENE_NODE_2376_length_1122_cov_8_048015_g1970_i0NODE_2376_length_1122_cov_8_048015_g1970_i0_p1_ORF_typecomplete_len308_score67_62DUF3887/PF13026_6/1_1DUF3887/PF13026_6/1_3e02_NODE_2376_length_1122_cov_8_048015_g1970_i01971054
MVVIPRPAIMKAEVEAELKRYRASLFSDIEELGSPNFILKDVKEKLINQLGNYISHKFQELQEQQNHSGHVDDDDDTSFTLMAANVLACDIVDTQLIKHLGLSPSVATLAELHDFMSNNLGLKFQANSVQSRASDATLRSMWQSHLEQLSRFTWFTNETVISQPGRSAVTYRVLRPQLFRTPHFSTMLIARSELVEDWNATNCSARKVINEQLTVALQSAIEVAESATVATIIEVAREGAHDWHSIAKDHGLLPTISGTEWELLFCDFLLEGILETAVSHLRELS